METSTGRICSNCGTVALHNGAYCGSCGQAFTVIQPITHSQSDFNVREETFDKPAARETVANSDDYVPLRVTSDDFGGVVERTDDDSSNGLASKDLVWKNINTARVFNTRADADRSDAQVVEQVRASPFESPRFAGAAVEDATTGAPVTGPRWQYSGAGQLASIISAPASTPAGASVRPVSTTVLTQGTIIAGRYHVTKHLGRGGFADIYLVTDSEDYLQEEIVLKLVDENLMRMVLGLEGGLNLINRNDLINAWRSKLKAWKVISEQEPALIVRLLGVPRIVFQQETNCSVGILMEYMPGGDLWQYLKAHGAPRSREQLTATIQLFVSACRAVNVLHNNRLLHRDIKPSNFLLNLAETHCKLSDFELILEINERLQRGVPSDAVGTPFYMAPECFQGKYSIRSDIFALGATLYHLLAGEHLRDNVPSQDKSPANLRGHCPEDLTRLNPLVSVELNDLVLRCLSKDPARRPSSIDELQAELMRLGLTGDAVNIAPVNLAHLLLTHLSSEDLQDLVQSLEESGFHSASHDAVQKRMDIVEEYCYTASPYDVLKDNCTTRQLRALMSSLGLQERSAGGRDELIEVILTSVGFLAAPREVPGIDATRTFLENLRLNLAHATTTDECVGMLQAGLSAVERTLDLLLSFYGQLLLGPGLSGFLKKSANGKPPERMTFGEKLGALRQLCMDTSPLSLPRRLRQVFKFPLIAADVFTRLGEVVRQRNLTAHTPNDSARRSLALAQRSGRQLLEHAVAILTDLAQNPNVPRVVQVISRQDDIYGRHFYLGRDDHGRSERIFTPFPLNVGNLYLFFPLTNPARINPLIFPFETPIK